ncbi:MAG: hypothetical protein AAFX01_04315 [Cyanobacteria bacterium J06638_28]
MTTLFDPTTVRSLQRALYAYIDNYGAEDSLEQVRAIAGTIVSTRVKAGTMVAQGREIESWVNQVVQGFDPTQLGQQIWNAGEQAIATQAKHWRETIETKAKATLDAYVQKHIASVDVSQLPKILATTLPIVADVQITRDEAQRLIHAISLQFDWEAAVNRVIDPKWITLAGMVARHLRHADLEAAVRDVMQVYIAKFQPAAMAIGEALAEKALNAVLHSDVLDIDIDLDLESRRLMIQQVSFKVNLMQASSPSSKTAMAIAQQIHDEVAGYRAQAGMEDSNYFPEVMTTDDSTSDSSVLGGSMSIGIDVQKTSD